MRRFAVSKQLELFLPGEFSILYLSRKGKHEDTKMVSQKERGISVTTREFSFRQELLLEKGAAVIGDYMRYENRMNLNDDKNPICILHDFVWNAKQDILASTTPEELDKIEGKFIIADQMLKSLEEKQDA